jgi:hypothetical protein
MTFILNECPFSDSVPIGNIHNTGIEAINFDEAKNLLKKKLRNENIVFTILGDSEEKFSYLITNSSFPIVGTLCNKELEYI